MLGSRHCGNLVLDTKQLFPEKGWKLCSVKAISKRVDERGSATELKSGKQPEQRKMLDTLTVD